MNNEPNYLKNLKQPRRCPKCKNFPNEVLQIGESTRSFEVNSNGLIDTNKPELTDDVNKYLLGLCECGHLWKFQNVTSVNDLPRCK